MAFVEQCKMDIDANLKSLSVRDQSAAALFLRAEGANGAQHLPALLEACQAIDPNNGRLDRFQEALLGFGAITMGSIIGTVGFDERDPLHLSILHWIAQSTSSPNLNVAGRSVYGLGNLQSRHPIAVDRLSELVPSERRSKQYEHVTRFQPKHPTEQRVEPQAGCQTWPSDRPLKWLRHEFHFPSNWLSSAFSGPGPSARCGILNCIARLACAAGTATLFNFLVACSPMVPMPF